MNSIQTLELLSTHETQLIEKREFARVTPEEMIMEDITIDTFPPLTAEEICKNIEELQAHPIYLNLEKIQIKKALSPLHFKKVWIANADKLVGVSEK